MSERRHGRSSEKPFSKQSILEMLERWMPQAASTQSQAAELAARATAKAAEVLDRQVLDQLSNVLTNGKPEMLARVINLYLVQSPKLVQKLKHAGGGRHAPPIERSAHPP